MPEPASYRFRQQLVAALNQHHPGWDVRRRAEWSPEHAAQWEQNRRFAVWSDTLKRWVRGDHFPRPGKFADFLDNTPFPTDTQQQLLTLYQQARQERLHARRRRAKLRQQLDPAPITDAQRTVTAGQPPLTPAHFFIGRQAALAHLLDWLPDPAVTLISIIGRAGAGKTALALEALSIWQSDVGDSAPLDGLVYVSAADTPTLAALIQRISGLLADERAAPIHEQLAAGDAPAALDNLSAALDDQQVLVLVEKAEGWLAETGHAWQPDLTLAALLSIEGLRLVLTARLDVPPLAAEDGPLSHTLWLAEGLTVSEGRALLRACDPNDNLGLNSAPDDLLAAAVRAVDGMPGGLMGLVSILERQRLVGLKGVLSALADDVHAYPEMRAFWQATLAGLDDASWPVLKALAVFGERASRQTLTDLLADAGLAAQAEPALNRLARHPLLRTERDTEMVWLADGVAHAIRQGLDDAQRQQLHTACAAWHVRQLKSPFNLHPAHNAPHHRAAFEHFWALGEYKQAYQAARLDQLATLWATEDEEIALRQRLNGQLEPPQAFHNSRLLAYHLTRQHRYPEASQVLATIVDAPPEIQAQAWLAQARIHFKQEHYDQALALLQQVVDHKPPSLDFGALPMEIDVCRVMMGQLPARFQHLATAALHPVWWMELSGLAEPQREQMLLWLEGAVRAPCEQWLRPDVCLGLEAALLMDEGRYQAAGRAIDRALAYQQRRASGQVSEVLLQQQARYHLARRDMGQARAAIEALQALAEQTDLARHRRQAVQWGAWLHLIDDQPDAARRVLNEQAAVLNTPPDHPEWRLDNAWLACLYLVTGDLPGAQRAITAARRRAITPDEDLLHPLRGIILARRGLLAEAQAAFDQGLVAANACLADNPALVQARYGRALSWAGLALLLTGDTQGTALAHAQDAFQDAYQACDLPGVVDVARWLLGTLADLDNAGHLEPIGRLLDV